MARLGAEIGAARWTVIDADDAKRWQATLARLPQHDVYHQPNYHLAYAAGEGVRACAYVAEVGDDVLLHPFLLRPIDKVGDAPARRGLRDIETVYGYAGPLATSDDKAFLATAWAGYDEWCRAEGVVCEFMRFHPWLENHRIAPPGTQVWRYRQTVAIDLGEGEEGLWRDYAGVHRNSLRKALKSGIVCRREVPGDCMRDFVAIYRQTMRHVSAEPFYEFGDRYFSAIVDGGRCDLFMVYRGDEPIAGALFLVDGEVMHYHLAGSDQAYRDLAPNNLLINEAARRGIARQCRWLHLGGGRTPAPEDSLFRFKARFSPHRRDLHLGKRIVDAAAYSNLNDLWRTQARPGHEPSYLQLYRLDPGQVGAP